MLAERLPEPAMAERIDSNLIYEILKDVQARLAGLEGMRGEMRDGFASLRAHLATQHGDAAFLERRVIELEKDMERVKRRLELAEPSDTP
jgi:septal ring factor EnvC (AmiA/AmiB activator)